MSLPEGWREVILKDIATLLGGFAFKSKDYVPDGIPILRMGNITKNFAINWNKKSQPFFPKDRLYEVEKYLLKGHDELLICLTDMSMTGDYLGTVALNNKEALLNQRVSKFIINKDIVDKKFLYYILREPKARKYFISDDSGSIQKNTGHKHVLNYKLFLPPLTQQKQIAQKLDQALARVERIKMALDNTPATIKRFRQSVLAMAISGGLTEDWREKQDELLSKEVIVSKLKVEKENFYNEQLLKWEKDILIWEDKGRTDKRPTRPRKVKEVPTIEDDELETLINLPKGMVWTRLGNLLGSVKDGPHYSPKYSDEGIPFISGGNIKTTGIDFKKNIKYISSELHEELSRRCKPELNDILYTKGGTTGIAKVNTYNFEFNVWVHVAVLKAIEGIDPFYIEYALNSHHCYQQSQKYTHGVGNKDLGLTRMILITLPICSLEEQKAIVKKVETLFALADNLEEKVNQAQKRVDRLTQSILAKAFRGEL